MNVSTNGHKKKDPTTGLDDGKAVAKLMRPFYEQLLRDAFGDAADAGIAVAFDLDNPFVQQTLANLAKKVKGVAETTKQEIRDLVGRQADEGWSLEQLQKEIRERGEIAGRTRAMLISRTETAAAYSQGSIAAYRASGVVKQTEWLLGPDPCDICQGLDGLKADLGEEFADGISAPPAHPNCTCALSPIVETE